MTPFEVILKYLAFTMALLYVVAGIAVLFWSSLLFDIPSAYVLPIGLALLGYGLFLIYRLYLKYYRKP